MIHLARGSVLLGLIVLMGFLFLFQPTAEAVTIANDSQESIKQEFIQKDNFDSQIIEPQIIQNQASSESAVVTTNFNSIKAFEGMSFRATAYCLKGRTAIGGGVRRGIVAADPRVLPLGTTITVAAGAYSGTYVVADTGGAVKGRILDIWVPSCSEAMRFGRRTVKVSVAGKKSR